MKKRRTPLRGLVKCRKQRTLLAKMLGSKEIESTLKAILYTQSNSLWRGLVATPPASFLETIVAEFKTKTSIPLELPFMSCFSLAAQYMAQQGAVLRLSAYQAVELDLYTLVLAKSGRCKSFTFNIINAALHAASWKPRMLDEPGSSAAFFETLVEANGKPIFWRIDEWGEFWLSLRTEKHQMTKRYLLLSYDHDPICNRLKSKGLDENGEKRPDKMEVHNVCLSVYGTSVTENVPKQLTPEDWKSGLVQRFGILVAHDDPSRPWFEKQYAFLDTIEFNILVEAWQKGLRTPVCQEYEFSATAREAIARTFHVMGRDSGLGEDFVRRIEFRIFKYSVVFHWMVGKSNAVIDEEDVGWGARLAWLHIEDLKYLLDATEYNDYTDLFARAVRLKEKLGSKFSDRNIRMYLKRHVGNMDEARALFRLVTDYPNMKQDRGC